MNTTPYTQILNNLAIAAQTMQGITVTGPENASKLAVINELVVNAFTALQKLEAVEAEREQQKPAPVIQLENKQEEETDAHDHNE